MKKLLEKNSTVVFITLSVVLVVVMLLVVVHPLELFTSRDAPFQVMAACLGAIVTALITAMLLNSQTKQQEKLQKASKDQDLEQTKKTEQYKHKMLSYQSFLERLFEVVKDRELTTEEKISMQFQTSLLLMHTESKHIEVISNNVGKVISCLCTPKKNYDVQELQKSLFEIVRQLREELYEDKISDDENALNNTLNNFVDAYKGVESADDQVAETSEKQTVFIWQQATELWLKNDQWNLLIDGETICLHRSNNRNIHVQFGFWKGHYYIQATYNPFSSFSQTLKWKYGGSRTYSTWWNHISTREYYDLNEGEFWQKFNDSELT